MARSKSGCLKILACAGAGSDPSADADADADNLLEESKAISDKSRWSFRRRSTRHRVLKNSEISEPETLSSSTGKSDVAASNSVYSSTYSYSSEKPVYAERPNEKKMEKPTEKTNAKPIEQQNQGTTEKPIEQENESTIEKPIEQENENSSENRIEKPNEKTIGKLIERPNEKSIVKTTEKPNEVLFSSSEPNPEKAISAIEGSNVASEQVHVESAAVVVHSGLKAYLAKGELSNEKDLVKLQAAIRGYLVRRQAVETLRCLLAIIKMQTLVRSHQARQPAGKFGIQRDKFQENMLLSSNEKLLLNGFALKIMGSFSTSKTMHIKCDPSKSDLAWKWMERWTILILPATAGRLLEHNREDRELADGKAEEVAQNEDKTVPSDSDLTLPSLMANDTATLEASVSVCVLDKCSGMSVKDGLEMELIENKNEDNKPLTGLKMASVVEESLDFFSGQQPMRTDPSSEPSLLLEKSGSWNGSLENADEIEQPLEMEEKRLVGRKPCNPAFAAAQLKFEELSSNLSVSSRPMGSSYQDGAIKLNSSSPHSQEEASTKSNNVRVLSESSVLKEPRVVIAASECGTEISISSTLDSPDRSEAEGGEIVLEVGSLENRYYASGSADIDANVVHVNAKNSSQTEVRPHKEDQQNGNLASSVVAADPVLVEQQHLELAASDLHGQSEKSVEPRAKSPEGTPRSRATITESHGTPSSEVSVNTGKSKNQKHKSRISKKSLSSPSSDLVGRSSTDNLSKESQHAKRENSLRVSKPDHGNQEPRISSSNPLPSYMQFTESARAKTSASISPKLSPDVQDNNSRKRHSLPMGNGNQDSSPRMQRSSSQAQQNAKGSGVLIHNSSDRRWQI